MESLMLSAAQARALGCLIEKAFTTPDAYPLSLNAVRVACNQATNREPVVDYDEAVVQQALDDLRALGLVTRNKAAGERAIKFRHCVHDMLGLDDAGVALLGVLLLRGAQTPGELRQRTERLHAFESTDAVESLLGGFAARELAIRLERRPGQKEARWATTVVAASDDGDHATDAPVHRLDADGRSDVVRSGEPRFDVVDPATGAVLRSVEAHDETEIAAKLQRARVAQRSWASRTYADRAAAVDAWRGLIGARIDELAATTTAETGKPIAHARNEVRAVGARMQWYCEHAESVLGAVDVSAADGLEERITYEPRGVVAHISAWNYPYFVGLNSIVPALLCGNAVLYKPSELATSTGLALVDLAHRAGVPVDVLQCVTGGGATGAALVDSGVDLVCFTGSLPTGRAIARAAAERLVPVQLELGGKDAAYVCDDVDIDAVAASVAEGVFYNAGQSCCAIERVYVHSAIFERFVAALVDASSAWRLGDPNDDTTTVGALARSAQPELLSAQLDDALSKGARVLVGGHRPSGTGNWFEPTIVVDVDHTMRLMREESFGPVIGVMAVADDTEALARIDDSEFGLTAAVFTTDRARAVRLLEAVDVGSVYWNCSDRTSVALPWAGRRHSGLGVSMSVAGIKAFVREKAWHLRQP